MQHLSEYSVFFLLGVVTGAGSSLLLLRFDGKWIKAVSLSGGAGVLVAEYLVFAETVGISDDLKASTFAWLLVGWIIAFPSILIMMLQSFKRQETKYKIQTWEILLGDKKAISQYYDSKKKEIDTLLESQFNVNTIKAEKEALDNEKNQLELLRKDAKEIINQADNIVCDKHCIDIPNDFKFPLKEQFIELIPRYTNSFAEFNSQLNLFTEDTISKITQSDRPLDELLEAYLRGICCYVGEHLFNWNDVRVHFRKLNVEHGQFEKYVACYKSGVNYTEELTPIPVDNSLIGLAVNTKRSIVYSANKTEAFDSGSRHLWKDYITMVFDKFRIHDKPALSLGVSVKHYHDHKDMMYFLSYIQVEQVIQENLLRINKVINIPSVLSGEHA